MFAGTAHCSQAYKKEFFLVRFWEFVYDYTTCINDWMSRFSDFLCWQTNKQTDRMITLPLADACSGVRKVYNHDFYSWYHGCNCKIVFVNILYQGYVWKKQRVCYCWLSYLWTLKRSYTVSILLRAAVIVHDIANKETKKTWVQYQDLENANPCSYTFVLVSWRKCTW